MPEQLTKHPEVTLRVLRSAGAQCGEGAQQSILTECPAQRFCKVPGGELCVFGLSEAPHMTQVTAADWQAVQQALSVGHEPQAGSFAADAVLVGAVGVVVGATLATAVLHFRRRRI